MKILIYPVLNTLLVFCVCCLFAIASFAQEKRASGSEEPIKSPSNLNPEHEKIKSRVSYVKMHFNVHSSHRQ